MNYAYVILGQRYETYATYAIQNQSSTLATDQDGTNSDGSSLTQLYFSSDNIISNDDTLLATPICSPLAPLAREIQTTSLGIYDHPVPLHTTHLMAALNRGVDLEPHFDERTNTFNNVATIELPQQQNLGPNLVIDHFLHEGVAGVPGDLTMDLSFTLWNAGVWQAGPSQVGFYHSYDDQFDANDTRLNLSDGSNTVSMDRIYPGWNERVQAFASLILPDQEGYLIVVADVANQIVESDEENWKSQSFAGYADLAIDSATYDAASDTWSVAVVNQGELSSQASEIGLLVDFQDQFRYSALPVWLNAFQIPSLRPGEISATFQTPAGWAPPASNRDTWLFFVVDHWNQIHERDETNNSAAPFYLPGTGQNDGKPDLIPDVWGFTHEIWPEPTALTAPDVAVSEFHAYLMTFPGSLKPVQGSLRLRVAVGTTPIQVQLQVIASTDPHFGSSDDVLLRDLSMTFTESQDLIVPITASINFNPPKDYLRVIATADVSETRVTNNSADTRFSLPDVMAVHSVTNQSNVGCGPSTVAVYMSQDSLPQISSQDDLISLYLNPGFSFGGTQAGHMIDYGPEFMDLFQPLSDWTMKFAVDILDAVDESDETNNVLVTNPDPSAYTGSWLPGGLPPLPNPGPGAGYVAGPGIDQSTAVTQVLPEAYLPLDDTALYDLRFKFKNNGKSALAIDNLSIFASPDFGLKNASLVFSSMLVGDAQGNKSFPTSVPASGESGLGQYTIRIPQNLMGTPYKLIFVVNGIVYDHRESDPIYLNFDGTDTRIMGILDPINL